MNNTIFIVIENFSLANVIRAGSQENRVNGFTFREKGMFEPRDITVEQIAKNDDVYRDLLNYKDKSEDLFRKIDGLMAEAKKKNVDIPQTASEYTEKAKHFFDIYDFLDAHRFAEAAVEITESAVMGK